MVDAADTMDPAFRGAAASGRKTEPATERATSWAMVHGPGGAALDSYEALAQNSVVAAPQHPLWVRCWVEETRPDYLVASLRIDGAAIFAVALEVERQGSLRIARYMGGSHANGNFAPAAAAWLESASAADLRALVHAIAKARPDIDLIHLERQLPEAGGRRNPLLFLPSMPSPNIALSLDLSQGIEAVLERTNGKRKRKKQRAQMRKFEAAGGYRALTSATADDVDMLFDAFLAMKHQRFAAMGIHDVFAEPKIRNFFRRLFTESLRCAAAPFRLDGLDVGGTLRAVTGSSVAGGVITCEFGAIREDELSSISPGEFLLFRNIEQASADGFTTYDLGVGDEPYKRHWCDVETVHFDTMVPLTLRGRIAAARLGLAARAKRVVKNNATLWAIAKKLRRNLRGSARSQQASEED